MKDAEINVLRKRVLALQVHCTACQPVRSIGTAVDYTMLACQLVLCPDLPISTTLLRKWKSLGPRLAVHPVLQIWEGLGMRLAYQYEVFKLTN